jgi:hypothetical protein
MPSLLLCGCVFCAFFLVRRKAAGQGTGMYEQEEKAWGTRTPETRFLGAASEVVAYNPFVLQSASAVPTIWD